jgi:hypothetical protein
MIDSYHGVFQNVHPSTQPQSDTCG